MKLTYNNPAFAKGEEIDLPGFGLIKNGDSFEVSDEEAKEYKERTGNSLAETARRDANFETAKGGKD